MDPWATVGIAVAAVVVVVGVYLGWVVWANRRAGSRGLARRVRLTCPKCGGSFEYAFVPGASLSSLRLGASRYLACPLCRRWSVIRLSGAPLVSPAAGDDPTAPPTG